MWGMSCGFYIDNKNSGVRMSKRLDGKVVLVIGSGSSASGWSNGKAISVLSAREGAKVFGFDINLDAAKETADLIVAEGGTAAYLQGDASSSEDIQAVVSRCLEEFGRIDVLFHNVGIVSTDSITDMSEEEWNRVFAINVTSAFITYKHVLPIMEGQGGGSIVATGSIAGIRYTGVPYASYYATKSAVMHMTNCLAIQYADKGIRANTVLPGLMDTPFIHQGLSDSYSAGDEKKMMDLRNQQCPSGKMGDAWDVANAAVFLACDESKYISGTNLVVDGGITSKF
jgi:NAD(P)-dependent dehydrogenase (short-subunit alcohol dehydrogenase family)